MSRPLDQDVVLEGLFEIGGLLGEAMRIELARHGLTPARAEVVWRLRGQGPMTQRELSQALRCSPRNVTGLVDGLESAGIVRREAHPTDRRATLVALTEAGAEQAAMWTSGYRTLAREAFADLRPDELAGLSAALQRVLTRLRAALVASPSGDRARR